MSGAMRVLSLFTGMGGFDLGFEMAGWEIVGQVEIDAYCNRLLGDIWPHVQRWKDIKTVSGSDVKEKCGAIDVVCGGFPCQDISAAGKGAGLEGERSGLWWEMHRVIGEVRPTWVVAENVDALRARGIDRVVGSLESLGYKVWCFGMAAENIGLPHLRKRIVIVAHDVRVRQHRPERQRGRGLRTVGSSKQLANPDDNRLMRSDLSEERREVFHGASGCRGVELEERERDKSSGELADAQRIGRDQGNGESADEESSRVRRSESSIGSQISDADSDVLRIESGRLSGQDWPYSPFAAVAGPGRSQQGWEAPRTVESTLGLTADGIPLKLALKAIGNGFVPAIPYLVAKAISRVGSFSDNR